ncbi:MAG TPA: porin [Steroidobacteraceae bacterium]|nr:porin [Steroidobacteraceae bacterium]
MNNGNMARLAARIASAGLLLATLAGVAQAQSTVTTSGSSKADQSITWNGITLYGIIDLGVQYQNHGAPISDYFPAGTAEPVQKFSNKSVTAVTPSNLSQSRIGLSGNEPLIGDWAGVFRLETFFNPQSGNVSDGLKSLTQNNGKALTAYTTGVDTSVAGQTFSISYLGFSSPTYGTITFGRQNTPMADGIAKYDPMGASQAFSLIGFSGTAAGGGDTEDRRLDQSLKYAAKYDWLHVGGLYQFSGSSGSKNTGIQATLGADFAGFSADAYYFKKYDAVASSSLSAAQVGELAGLCNPPPAVPPAKTPAPQCYSVYNSLSATISDNTTYSGMVSYKFAPLPLTLYGGYEHISFDNPTNPLKAGTVIEGGYVLAFASDTAYANNKVLQVYWGGAKYSLTPALDVTVAYYGYHQNAYSTEAALAGCSTQKSAACSGTEETASIMFDYRLSKRFDAYVGTFWSEVKDGLASGFLLASPTEASPGGVTSTAAVISTTMGIRFRF